VATKVTASKSPFPNAVAGPRDAASADGSPDTDHQMTADAAEQGRTTRDIEFHSLDGLALRGTLVSLSLLPARQPFWFMAVALPARRAASSDASLRDWPMPALRRCVSTFAATVRVMVGRKNSRWQVS
jgi:hypothetical protein